MTIGKKDGVWYETKTGKRIIPSTKQKVDEYGVPIN